MSLMAELTMVALAAEISAMYGAAKRLAMFPRVVLAGADSEDSQIRELNAAMIRILDEAKRVVDICDEARALPTPTPEQTVAATSRKEVKLSDVMAELDLLRAKP